MVWQERVQLQLPAHVVLDTSITTSNPLSVGFFRLDEPPVYTPFTPPTKAFLAPLRWPCSYLALQDVPRTADHAPSRTFYTWRANAGVAKARMASDLYRAAGNLHARLAHEMSKKEELVQLLEGPSVASHVLERREQEIVALRAVTTRLEASLLDLDAQIMLFNDV